MSAKMILGLVLVGLAAVYVCGEPSFGGYNPSQYPGMVSGFSSNIFNYRPNGGYKGCRYWCKSTYTKQYYCCSNLGAGGIFGGSGGRGVGGHGGVGGGHGGFGSGHGGFGSGHRGVGGGFRGVGGGHRGVGGGHGGVAGGYSGGYRKW